MPAGGPPTALVTGGASGIGRAVAERWVRDGGRVALLDQDAGGLAGAVEALGAEQAVGAVADVCDPVRVTDTVAAMAQELGGRLDAVVCCAGISRPISAHEGPDAEWVHMIDIHLHGTMRACRAAYPFLRASDRAAVVTTSSIAGSTGRPGRSSYSAAKAGIEGLTRALAVEWSPHVRVNAVAPGYVHTPMIDDLVAAGRLDPGSVLARTPLARMGEAREIAAAVAFLASPEASFVTGQTLLVDGGITVEGDWYRTPG